MPRIERTEVAAYQIPTDSPESDGTLEWSRTTMVVVHVAGGGKRGLGWSYADTGTARLIRDRLAEVVVGLDAMDVPCAWLAMRHAIRNLGRPGMASMAISAVDCALWDLKARLLELPLCRLLGAVRERMPIYGSGGFTSYDATKLAEQLGGWAGQGIPRVKMKVGRVPADDPDRVRVAREAIGPATELFVDANGAYSRKQALALSDVFAAAGVRWFEEPVSSDDLDGLRLVRDRVPMEVAAGEYGYDLPYFRRMLEVVDVLQADITRCGGLTGFLQVGTLCDAAQVPLSAHCAPTLHVPAGCAVPRFVHAEWFHDHVRIERMLLDGALQPRDGALWPDLSRPGFGVELKRDDAEQFLT